MKRQYTAREVAEIYDLPIAFLYRRIERKQLRSVRVKGRHMISEEELKRHPENFWDIHRIGDDTICLRCEKHFKRRSTIHKYCSIFCQTPPRPKRKKCGPEDRAKRNRKSQLKRDYGITLEQYDEMCRIQNDLCAVCCEPERHKKRRLSVDHDHATGIVRGLLCHRCNKALGLLRENIKTLKNMIKYLSEKRRKG